MGIPIRLLRKNKDEQAPIGIVVIYDGLYDVVRVWFSAGWVGVMRDRLVGVIFKVDQVDPETVARSRLCHISL